MDARGKRPNGSGILAILLKDFHHTLIVSGMLDEEKKQKGYIALISIMIIVTVALIVALDVNLFGVSESDMGLKQNQSTRAFYLAMLCAEDALMKLKNNLAYQGNETISIEEGECSILPVEGSGNFDRIIKTTGTVHSYTRKIKIEVSQVNPKMVIKSWQEVSDF